MKNHADMTVAGMLDETSDHSKPIDLPYLERTTFSDKDLADEVLALFRASAGSYLEALKTATTAKDWFDAAHSLKGSAKAVGAFRLAGAAANAESLEGAPMSAAQAEALCDL